MTNEAPMEVWEGGEMAQPAEPARGQEGLWLRILPLLPGVITVLGVVLYGALLGSYRRFYGAFNVDPEDVGLGYVTTLTRSMGFIVLLALAVAIALIQVLTFRLRPLEPSASETLKQVKRRQSRLRNKSIMLAITSAGMAIYTSGTVIFLLTGQIDQQIERVREGREASDPELFFFTIIDLNGEPSRIQWLNSQAKPADPAADPANDELIYLGGTSTHSIFWDKTRGETLRIPVATVLITHK